MNICSVKRLNGVVVRALFIAAILVAAPALNATSVLPPDFNAMVRQADLIFTGRMTGQRAEWRKIEGQRSIVTLVRFEVIGVHKGRGGPVIELQFLGGKIGQASLDVDSIPKFHVDERVVLFVEQNGVAASPLVGFFHGKFNVLTDGTVTHHDGAPLGDVADIGKSRARRGSTPRAMAHDEFAGKIRGATQKAN